MHYYVAMNELVQICLKIVIINNTDSKCMYLGNGF